MDETAAAAAAAVAEYLDAINVWLASLGPYAADIGSSFGRAGWDALQQPSLPSYVAVAVFFLWLPRHVGQATGGTLASAALAALVAFVLIVVLGVIAVAVWPIQYVLALAQQLGPPPLAWVAVATVVYIAVRTIKRPRAAQGAR